LESCILNPVLVCFDIKAEYEWGEGVSLEDAGGDVNWFQSNCSILGGEIEMCLPVGHGKLNEFGYHGVNFVQVCLSISS